MGVAYTKVHLFCTLAILGCSFWPSINASAADDAVFEWVVRMGASGSDGGQDVAVDGSGNVYTTGYFVGTVDFEPGGGTSNLSAEGNDDVFVQKLNADGELQWAKAMGGSADDVGRSIAVDNAGNVYTAGEFRNTADFDPGSGTADRTSVGGNDIFVQKLDANGSFEWGHSFGSATSDAGYGVAADGAGNVYVTGMFEGTVDFNPSLLVTNRTSMGNGDIFVLKLDANGDLLWVRAIGGDSDDIGHGIAVDDTGNVYVVGEFRDTVDFDPSAGTANLSGGNSGDAFVWKLDSDGDLVWVAVAGASAGDVAYDVVLDASNVYITGAFRGTVDFDPSGSTANRTPAGGDDIFVWKLSSSASYRWAAAMGGTDTDAGLAIALDGLGNVYTVGYYRGRGDFDPGAGTFFRNSFGEREVFISKLDSDGSFEWAKDVGGTQPDEGHGIAVTGSNDVYVAGLFAGTVDFDPVAPVQELTSGGGSDIFVLKLAFELDVGPTADSIVPETTGPTSDSTIDFTVEFSEAVANFNDAADVVVAHNGTAHTGVSISGNGDTHTVTVSGASGDGSFTLAVNVASDVEDLGGLALTSSVTSAPVVIEPPGPDVTPPVISLIGFDRVLVEQFDPYVDPGATALDDRDGDISEDIDTVNPVDFRVLGDYTITYNVMDAAGNAADTATRSVKVYVKSVYDLDDSGAVNIIDLQLIINAILQLPGSDEFDTDVNGDGFTNVVDLFDMVEIILAG
jgi:hypothetical protein